MAIARDVGENFSQTTGFTKTCSHVLASSPANPAVLCHVFEAGPTPSVTGATWAGSTATQTDTQAEGNSAVNGIAYLFLKANAPTTGTQNYVISSSLSIGLQAIVVSYTGVNQSDTADNHNKNFATAATSQSLAITPSADNCWMVTGFENNQGANTAGSNTVVFVTSGGNARFVGDSNGPIHPAAQLTQSITWTGSGTSSAIGVTLAPAGGAAAAAVSLAPVPVSGGVSTSGGGMSI